MISYIHITKQAKQACSILGIGVTTDGIHTSEDTECVIEGEVFYYRCRYYLNSQYRYILLFEHNDTIDVPLDFEELDRKLRLFS